MNFFTKHYEKILLAVLLAVFVILLVALLQITKSAKNISERDLAIKAPVPDYESVDFSDAKFKLDKVFALKVAWEPYGTRMTDADGNRIKGVSDDLVSDLLSPLRAAKCPGCNRFIPLFSFKSAGQCPICGMALSRPARSFNDEIDIQMRSSDSDGDGMPNIFELKYPEFLNPTNPLDAKYDRDNDGFTNLYEYMCGTDIDDAKSHPPLTDLIYIESARPPLLSAQLESADADSGTVRFSMGGKGRPREYKVGSTVSFDRRSMTIDRILSPDSVQMKINNTDKDFIVRKGVAAELPEEEMTVMNLGNNKLQTGVKVGSTIEIGNNSSGKEKWKVVAMDMKNAAATLEGADGKTYELTAQSKITSRARKPE
ncbi:MAG: hypothetical protein PHI85_05940 [Victivallaceae bacterium]|nr:hypothetical protein [Victivallaceae bacterium]